MTDHSRLSSYVIRKIGKNRGAPRIWLEGAHIERAGFAPGQKFDVDVQGKTIVLEAKQDGTRTVSAKRKGDRTNPVIDINSREMLAIFDGMGVVRIAAKKGVIVIIPLASELRKQERLHRLRKKLKTGDPLLIGSLSHGAGVLSHAIHRGLHDAGVPSRLAFANEIRPELLDQAVEHNETWDKDTQLLGAPMQELAFDEKAMAHLPKTEILEMGLPCSGASVAGRAKRKLAHPEEHPEVGHLVVAALTILAKTNAAIVILENAPGYQTSASADILRNYFRDLGYTVHEREFVGTEWGALEKRKRWCLVAVTQGIEFNFSQLVPPQQNEPPRLGHILEDIPLDDASWKSVPYIKGKWIRDQAAGKNFEPRTLDGDATEVPTITKGYAKIRSTDPMLIHPDDPDRQRLFTPVEHARIKGVPEHLIEDTSNTLAHEILGQSVVYEPFRAMGEHIGRSLKGEMPEVIPACDSKADRLANDQLDYIADRFGDGECGTFSQALSHITALHVVLFRSTSTTDIQCPPGFPRHAAIEIKPNEYLDATGIFNLQEAQERFGCSFRIDDTPDLSAYPFGLEEEWREVLSFAYEMLRLRKLEYLIENENECEAEPSLYVYGT